MTEETGRRVIDLDAAAEARAANRGEPIEVVFKGDTFELPAELPADFLELIADDRLTPAMVSLLGEEEAVRFMGHKPSVEDLIEFAQGIAAEYGFPGGLGNSLASGAGSSNTSSR